MAARGRHERPCLPRAQGDPREPPDGGSTPRTPRTQRRGGRSGVVTAERSAAHGHANGNPATECRASGRRERNATDNATFRVTHWHVVCSLWWRALLPVCIAGDC